MKKLMTLMLGFALVCGTVAVAFAQNTSKQASKGKNGSGNKGGKNRKPDVKKDGGTN